MRASAFLGPLLELEVASTERTASLLVQRFATTEAVAARLLDAYARATYAFLTASRASIEAEFAHQGTKRAYNQVAADYVDAERNYRIATAALVVLATSHAICEGTMNAARFREEMRKQGVSLENLDVDHVFPRSFGGIDHPLNYELMESSLNRSLGNRVMRKFLHAPLGFVGGLAVSALGALGGCGPS